jgi:hypothetical protein
MMHRLRWAGRAAVVVVVLVLAVCGGYIAWAWFFAEGWNN